MERRVTNSTGVVVLRSGTNTNGVFLSVVTDIFRRTANNRLWGNLRTPQPVSARVRECHRKGQDVSSCSVIVVRHFVLRPGATPVL